MYKLFIKKNISSKDLLKKVLKKYHTKYDIFYNEYGKPYLKNSKYFFNISHSGDYTVCILADREVGIDIQKITHREKVIDKVCTNEEKKLIKTPKDFTKIWVKKESYVKYLGVGLAYGLKNVNTLKIKNIKLKKFKNYYIAICI